MYIDTEAAIATRAAFQATKLNNILESTNIVILPRNLDPNPNNIDLTKSG